MIRVYADMVADLFHSGHVEFLRRARALGDELVVGVHSDRDCEWYKRRPVLTLDERVALVRACRYVDRVIPGAPLLISEAYLRELGVDLVVHGDDMDEALLRRLYPVPSALGILRTVPYTQGISSRSLEERVRAARRPAAPGSARDARRSRRRRWLRRWPALHVWECRRAFAADLRRLHDALRGTPIDGRYWVWGGMLLGWAREGRLLAHDLRDADFAYLDEDHARFLDSVPALAAAGFAPAQRFSDAGRRYVEHRFLRDRRRFEFFRFTPVGDRWRYASFDEDTEYLSEIRAQPRVAFHFLGREWSKVADHAAELAQIYGDWRTPRPEWSLVDDASIIERRSLPPCVREWDWPFAAPRGPGEIE